MDFIPGVFAPEVQDGESLWFAFYQGRILMLQDQHGLVIPQIDRFSFLGIPHKGTHYLGQMQGMHCFTTELESDSELPHPFSLHELRRLSMMVDTEWFMVAGRARQIVEWDANHQFCGRCGTQTVHHEVDRAKLCPQCGHTQYPRISPCIIVLVTKGEDILLARSASFPPGLFSTLAGFVEAGETLEMTVHREIKEEVGITVKNLKYKGSQPWPFPHSLMVGFHAEYAGGSFVFEDEEIEEAAWWPVTSLPMIPPVGSIARSLIDTYVKEFRGES
ncbi:NAD(+) diphosphatase [Ketobacter sp. MCCC 1A13808]|uniref:NAD(+) diphosphatase n=1 Tax=Ketobacter sp. MCCC 1A13808 TaxID=2602738 RepID=UPI000F11D3F5|nr:NAD(+) diphosphatase [Ketobacter sp. MCCC 1A13808]MVF12423.1 NAD(+) diphosphatase [Ketobacter sp. MCCC 1A13808]RLP55764.1 MAG: NAD(+) diphosphatase [Ketobacter sp.]